MASGGKHEAKTTRLAPLFCALNSCLLIGTFKFDLFEIHVNGHDGSSIIVVVDSMCTLQETLCTYVGETSQPLVFSSCLNDLIYFLLAVNSFFLIILFVYISILCANSSLKSLALRKVSSQARLSEGG